MKENLFGLLDLQEIDKGIDSLGRSRSEYPEEIAKLQAEIEAAREKFQANHDRFEALEKHRRTLERDLEAVNSDLKKHQDRLYEVKTNKEYDALQHEIGALNVRIEEHETGILEAIEEQEGLKEMIDEEAAIFREMETETLARIKELTTHLDSIEVNVKTRQDKRAVVEARIERRPLSIYNRIRKTLKGGIAVVPVEKGSCGGCFRELAPQRRVETRRQDQIIRCENCGRILVWREEVAV